MGLKDVVLHAALRAELFGTQQAAVLSHQVVPLAAAGKMGLEAGHTGVDGFTALQAGDSCGESPPTTLHKGHPTSTTSEHSGLL